MLGCGSYANYQVNAVYRQGGLFLLAPLALHQDDETEPAGDPLSYCRDGFARKNHATEDSTGSSNKCRRVEGVDTVRDELEVAKRSSL